MMKETPTYTIGGRKIPIYTNHHAEQGRFMVVYQSPQVEQGPVFSPFILTDDAVEKLKKEEKLEEQRIIEIKRNRDFSAVKCIIISENDMDSIPTIIEKLKEHFNVGNDTEG